MKPVAPVLPGETLGGKYRVERIIGEGGMGVVVAARHLALDERVAIKFLIGKPSEPSVERFLREARAAAKVKGEHVCRVFDFGRLETGEPYIVMEHLEGIDLARKLAREGRQDPSLVAGWVIEACDALAEAHALGIVHRDLKPANLFLAKRPDGSSCAKVLDFGISKLPYQAQITRTTATMGSPAYMSPEQLESSRDVDARSDVWSLGVVLYELLSGTPPFKAESMIGLALTIREKAPPPIDGISPELGRVVSRCLAKDPAGRYANALELATDLAPFAPPDVAGLVARLERRKATTPVATGPDERPARAEREADDGESRSDAARAGTPVRTNDDAPARDENATPPPPSPLADSIAVDVGPVSAASPPLAGEKASSSEPRTRGTFAPIQSTMDAAPVLGSRRRNHVIAAGAGLLVVVLLAGRVIRGGAFPGGAGTDPIASASAGPSASAPAPTASASLTEPPPSAPANAPERAAPALTASTGPLPSSIWPHAKAPPSSPQPTATMTLPPTPSPVEALDAGAPPPAASILPSASTSAEQPRKRRQLDREDPL